MSVTTDTEANQQLSSIVTFYKLDCPKCGAMNVGDDVYDNWREGEKVTCKKCGYEGEPETRKVDLAE